MVVFVLLLLLLLFPSFPILKVFFLSGGGRVGDGGRSVNLHGSFKFW
jgi:type IV secretory pathway TrbL component